MQGPETPLAVLRRDISGDIRLTQALLNAKPGTVPTDIILSSVGMWYNFIDVHDVAPYRSVRE